MHLVSLPAAAEQPLFANHQGRITVFGEAGIMTGHVENANFGAGVVDYRTSAAGRKNLNLYEAYIEPGIRGEFRTARHGKFYGELSAVAALTEGQGDAGGYTRGNERDIDPESYHMGWRSGSLFPVLGEDAIDISVGAQMFQVGDQFLFGDGNAEAFDDGVYFMGPRDSFKNSAIARLITGGLSADAFYLRADKENDSAEQAGINAGYDFGFAKIGGTYFNIFDAMNNYTVRMGMEVADVRFTLDGAGAFDGMNFSGEYVSQNGASRGTKLNADGWHLTAKYTATDWSWSPYARYRYSRFSGDDPDTTTRESYDPLFYGFTQYGDWFQGNIAGNYFLFNSNQRTHMFQIGATPTEWLQLDAIYYSFDLDQKSYNSTRTADRHFGDEINLVAQVFLSENTWSGLSLSYLMPGKGALQTVGDDQDMFATEFFVVINF